MSQKKYLSHFIILFLLFSFGCMSCNNQTNPPIVEFTDGPVEIIYERTEPYVSSEFNDSTVAFECWFAERNATYESYWNMIGEDMIKISETRFTYTTEILPVDLALYIGVLDFGKAELGEPHENGERIFINGVELTKIGPHPRLLNNPGTVAYFLIKKDGSVIP